MIFQSLPFGNKHEASLITRKTRKMEVMAIIFPRNELNLFFLRPSLISWLERNNNIAKMLANTIILIAKINVFR